MCKKELLGLGNVLTSFASASSSPPRPIKRIAHPSTLALEVLPRRTSLTGNYGKRSYPADAPVLRHTDSFRLKLAAFDDVFHLHLRPNEHLIHPAARINHYTTGPDGKSVFSHAEPLLPESVRVYWGEVVDPDATADRLREDAAGVWPRPAGKSELGWARITVHDHGDISKAPIFEGAFSVNGDVHHITTKDRYLRTKHHMDPHLHFIDAGDDIELVIWRDSDVMTPHELNAALGLDNGPIPTQPPRTCAHDTLSYNTDPLENPALRRPLEPSWYDPFGFLDTYGINSSLTRRDDVAGGGVSTK